MSGRVILDYEIPPGRPLVGAEGRNRVASATASFLRGEIDNLEFHRQTFELETSDESLRDICFSLYFMYDDFRSHPVCVSPEGWEYLVRVIAFLKSDLKDAARSVRNKKDRRARRVRGLASLASIVVAVYLASTFSPLALLLPGAAIGLLILIETRISKTRPHDSQFDEPSFYPFESKHDWLAHAHLVDAENLPRYDPAVHAQPIRPVRNRFRDWLMFIPAIVPMALVVFVFVPLLSLLNLFDSVRRPEGKRSRTED